MLGYNSSVNIKNSIIELCYEKTAKLVEDNVLHFNCSEEAFAPSLRCKNSCKKGSTRDWTKYRPFSMKGRKSFLQFIFSKPLNFELGRLCKKENSPVWFVQEVFSTKYKKERDKIN
jgi:hypothetical protein